MAHSLRANYFHVVWATKSRKPFITPDVREELYPYIGGIISNYKGTPIAIGGWLDHIHLLIELKHYDQYSALIQNIKTGSSHWIHKKFPSLRAFAWQEGYASFSVSYSALDQVKHYIQRQEDHHQTTTFQEEYLKILNFCNIKYDERFVLG